MDVENKKQLALGKRLLTDVIHAFCQRLEEKGFWVGIYSSQSYFSGYMYDGELQRYAHWVACWAKSCSYPGNCFGLWQYGGSTNMIRSNQVAGQTCDQNYLLVDYPALIRNSGLNGFNADTSSPPSTEGSLPEVTPLPAPSPAPEAPTLSAGMKLNLSGVALYGSSTVASRAATKTGTYYLWDGEAVNGRVRITKSSANVGKAGQVTGWINVSDIQISEKSDTQTPTETVYTVKAGDSLWAIAEKYLGDGRRYTEIVAANGLKSTTIYAGNTLKIPAK